MPIKNLNNLLNTHNTAVIDFNKGDLYPHHLSFPQYPLKCEKVISLKNGTLIHIRPIHAEDEPSLRRFFEKLSEESVFFRFGQRRIYIPHDQLARLCRVDYERDLTFLAVIGDDEEIIIGDARLNVFPDLQCAELSFVVADQWQGKGIGNLLMEFCIVAARNIGLKTLLMEVMKKNTRMKQFGYKYGFQSLPCNKEDDMEEMQLSLDQTGIFLRYFHQHSGTRYQREQMFKDHYR